MSAQLEHTMIKDGRPRLQQIRNKTYELNSLLWAALLTDDDRTARRDLEWATELSLEVTRGLLEFTGDNKHATAEWLMAAPSSPSDQG
jgi:hypothetical protein